MTNVILITTQSLIHARSLARDYMTQGWELYYDNMFYMELIKDDECVIIEVR